MTRVLITGGAGFIGHHLVDFLLKNTDWKLIILDRLDFAGDTNRLTDLSSVTQSRHRLSLVWWDLKSSLNEHVSNRIGAVDHIIHLAASSHVDRSIADPMSFIMDNVVGTTNLLLWAKDGGLRGDGKFINFSTDEVFGPASGDYSHKEDDPHKPSNPYSASKSGQEAIGYAFFITYALPVITTHTMNNFGERQHPEKLVQKTIRSVIKQISIPIYCSLNGGRVVDIGSRFWIHCQNTASAILFLLQHGIPGETYNIISRNELSNLEIAEKIATIIDKPLIPEFVDFHQARPGHDRRYALDGSKLAAMGWKPVLGFDESLVQTVKFTLERPEWQ